MLWGSKPAVALVYPYILTPHLPLSPSFLPCTWIKGERKGETKREREREKKKLEVGIPGS
jgi:hypothetical protein